MKNYSTSSFFASPKERNNQADLEKAVALIAKSMNQVLLRNERKLLPILLKNSYVKEQTAPLFNYLQAAEAFDEKFPQKEVASNSQGSAQGVKVSFLQSLLLTLAVAGVVTAKSSNPIESNSSGLVIANDTSLAARNNSSASFARVNNPNNFSANYVSNIENARSQVVQAKNAVNPKLLKLFSRHLLDVPTPEPVSSPASTSAAPSSSIVPSKAPSRFPSRAPAPANETLSEFPTSSPSAVDNQTVVANDPDPLAPVGGWKGLVAIVGSLTGLGLIGSILGACFRKSCKKGQVVNEEVDLGRMLDRSGAFEGDVGQIFKDDFLPADELERILPDELKDNAEEKVGDVANVNSASVPASAVSMAEATPLLVEVDLGLPRPRAQSLSL